MTVGDETLDEQLEQTKPRRRPEAPVYIDETQLPPDHSLDLIEELVELPSLDKDGKPVRKKHPFRGVKIGLVSLTSEEQIQALERGQGRPGGARIHTLKAMMRSFNGRAIKWNELEQDDIYESIGMKGQALLAGAYGRIAVADEEAVLLMNAMFRWA